MTDNGGWDLLTIILTTGNAVLYGAKGPARNPGQTRVAILLSMTAARPLILSDDEFLEFLGVVKDLTGRCDDRLCEAAVPLLT